MIRAHQPGSEPIDIPETIPNPVVETEAVELAAASGAERTGFGDHLSQPVQCQAFGLSTNVPDGVKGSLLSSGTDAVPP